MHNKYNSHSQTHSVNHVSKIESNGFSFYILYSPRVINSNEWKIPKLNNLILTFCGPQRSNNGQLKVKNKMDNRAI